jgi:transposase
MIVVEERCAFLDVHRDIVVACARTPDDGGGRREEVQSFSTTSKGLLSLASWLVERGVRLVGMEATGVYWKPVHWVLEDVIDKVWVINARHMRNVPGRKTDVGDAQWGCQLLEHGLVRPSFIPDRPGREERDLTRYRRVVVEDRGRESQRLHKVLEDAGIKLASFTSKVLTVSGREMIDALIAGQRDPAVLAEMARGRMRSKIPELVEALDGRFNAHHAMLCQTMLTRIDQADQIIEQLTNRVVELQSPHEAAVRLLIGIPGVSYRTAQVILAEIGTDMSRFPTAGHLASWAGMCPGNNESAGKHKSGRTRHGSKWLRIALIEAAHAAARSKDTYLSAHYHRIRGRRGPAKAAVAVGHTILVICWHLLSTGEVYNDLGGDYFDKRRTSTAHQRRLIAQLEAIGLEVTITPKTAA